jgi:hypothetical protein
VAETLDYQKAIANHAAIKANPLQGEQGEK